MEEKSKHFHEYQEQDKNVHVLTELEILAIMRLEDYFKEKWE